MATPTSASRFRDGFASLSDVRSPELIYQRQNQIVDAAIPLLYRHGFHKTTVRAVADAAGMSMGNLYQYIKTKDDILVLVAVRLMEHLDEVYLQSSSSSPDGRCANRIAALLRGYISVINENRPATKLLYRESASLSPEILPELLTNIADHARFQFAEILREGISAGEVDGDSCHVEILAMNLLMFGHTWALKGWALKHFVSAEDYTDEQVKNALRMIPFRKPVD